TLFVVKSEPELLSLKAEDFVERFIIKGTRPILKAAGILFFALQASSILSVISTVPA
ncbi:unnamed protein product, partial [marine sediment metagenome]